MPPTSTRRRKSRSSKLGPGRDRLVESTAARRRLYSGANCASTLGARIRATPARATPQIGHPCRTAPPPTMPLRSHESAPQWRHGEPLHTSKHSTDLRGEAWSSSRATTARWRLPSGLLQKPDRNACAHDARRSAAHARLRIDASENRHPIPVRPTTGLPPVRASNSRRSAVRP